MANIRIRPKNSNYDAYLAEPTTCPICHSKIVGKYLTSSNYGGKDQDREIIAIFYCSGCDNCFITIYHSEYDAPHNAYKTMNIESFPNKYVEEPFDDSIKILSPNFVKIYNQAKAAESYNLDEIAGIGYRKAIEFLVKDFIISENLSDEEDIKNLPLAKCINNYIENVQIKTLAEKSTWIGNDETHYVRKHQDRDIEDMKNFIRALVYFISMYLIAKDAESIPHS